MELRTLFFTALLFLFVWDVYSVLPKRAPFADPGAPPEVHYKQGIIHVHSVFSDGGGTVPEIANAAHDAGMDFVVLTDHNTSKARAEGFEKNYNGVDMYVEMEASTPAGHSLIFYSHTPARTMADAAVSQLAYDHFLGKDTRPGVFTVTAHPSNIKIPWTSLDRSPDGTEVINFDSVWRQLADDGKLDFAATVLTTPFNEFLAALRFLKFSPKDLLAWDTMNSVSKGHFGIIGHDTHAKLKIDDKRAWHWPDYLSTFKLASNIIYYKEALPADFEERKRELYHSLREGRSAIAMQVVYPFAGNDWRLMCGTQSHHSGDEVPASKSCEFVAELPKGFPYKATYRLVRNGEPYKEATVAPNAAPAHFPVDLPGAYRMEVWADLHTQFHVMLSRPVPYVFYNPIYVR